MRLSIGIGPLGPPGGKLIIEQAQAAESMGYDTIWSHEIYGSDCFTPLAWIAAHTKKIKIGTSIMQISARTPTSAAMHAVTLDYLSNGRFNLGIGVSGPQVVEGWYGQPYPKPLARTREWIQIFRDVVSREKPLTFSGNHYQLPLEGGMGLGKPLKLILHPMRENIPLYLGAEGPKNVALGAELCDGWIPMFLSPYRMELLYKESLKSATNSFDIVAPVPVNIDNNLDRALAPIKQNISFYVGGMGAKNFNVHKDHFVRMGYSAEADRIQELFMARRRDEAAAAVPDEIADEVSLCGTKERIRDRLQAWCDSQVTCINVGARDVETLQFMAECCL